MDNRQVRGIFSAAGVDNHEQKRRLLGSSTHLKHILSKERIYKNCMTENDEEHNDMSEKKVLPTLSKRINLEDFEHINMINGTEVTLINLEMYHGGDATISAAEISNLCTCLVDFPRAILRKVTDESKITSIINKVGLAKLVSIRCVCGQNRAYNDSNVLQSMVLALHRRDNSQRFSKNQFEARRQAFDSLEPASHTGRDKITIMRDIWFESIKHANKKKLEWLLKISRQVPGRPEIDREMYWEAFSIILRRKYGLSSTDDFLIAEGGPLPYDHNSTVLMVTHDWHHNKDTYRRVVEKGVTWLAETQCDGIWIDMICCPYQSEARQRVIMSFSEMYYSAEAAIIVISREEREHIQGLLFNYGIPIQESMNSTSWYKRAWTWQEENLAKSLAIDLDIGVVELRTRSHTDLVYGLIPRTKNYRVMNCYSYGEASLCIAGRLITKSSDYYPAMKGMVYDPIPRLLRPGVVDISILALGSISMNQDGMCWLPIPSPTANIPRLGRLLEYDHEGAYITNVQQCDIVGTNLSFIKINHENKQLIVKVSDAYQDISHLETMNANDAINANLETSVWEPRLGIKIGSKAFKKITDNTKMRKKIEQRPRANSRVRSVLKTQ